MAVTSNPNIIMGYRGPEIANPMAIAAQGEQLRTARNQNAMAEATLAGLPAKAEQERKQKALEVGKLLFGQAGSAADFNQKMDAAFGADMSDFHVPDDATFGQIRDRLYPQKGMLNQPKGSVVYGADDAYLVDTITGEKTPLGVGLKPQKNTVVDEEMRNAKLRALEATAKEKEGKVTPSDEPVFEAETVLSDLSDLAAADLGAIYGKGESIYPDIARKQSNVDLIAKRDRVSNLVSLESRNKLKGQGTITDQESAMLAKASTILTNPEISPELAAEEIKRVTDIFQRARDRAAKKVSLPTKSDKTPLRSGYVRTGINTGKRKTEWSDGSVTYE